MSSSRFYLLQLDYCRTSDKGPWKGQPPYKGHSSGPIVVLVLWEKDNLSTENKVADLKVSFIRRFHCNMHYNHLHVFVLNITAPRCMEVWISLRAASREWGIMAFHPESLIKDLENLCMKDSQLISKLIQGSPLSCYSQISSLQVKALQKFVYFCSCSANYRLWAFFWLHIYAYINHSCMLLYPASLLLRCMGLKQEVMNNIKSSYCQNIV